MTKQRANQILAAVAHAFADAPRREGASTLAATFAALAFDREPGDGEPADAAGEPATMITNPPCVYS